MDDEYDLTEAEQQRVDDLAAGGVPLDTAWAIVLAEREPPVIVRDVIAAG